MIPSIDKIKQIHIEFFNVFKEGFVQKGFLDDGKSLFPLCHLHNMPFTAKHLPHWISAPYKETVWVCERVADPGSWGNVVCILFMQSAYFLCSVHTFYAVCILFMKTAYSLCSLPTFYAVCILFMHPAYFSCSSYIFQAICRLFAPFSFGSALSFSVRVDPLL